MKSRFAELLIFIVLSLCVTGCEPANQRVIINGRVEARVEVAKSEDEKHEGLMGRTELADGTGMLFIYGAEVNPTMWMKNMLIPLDMVFIGEDLKINHIEENVNPCNLTDDKGCARYQSPVASSLVLELPAGYAKSNSIVVGDSVELVGITGL